MVRGQGLVGGFVTWLSFAWFDFNFLGFLLICNDEATS